MGTRSNKDPIFGKQVKALRIYSGFTQSELASKVGVSANYISIIESGVTPSDEMLDKLAQEFGVSVDTLCIDDPIRHEVSKLVEKAGLEKILAELKQIMKETEGKG